MDNNMIRVLLQENYNNINNIIFKGLLQDCSEIHPAILTFHMRETYVVTTNDEYFCDIRANNFVVEYGYSEEGVNPQQPVVLITGNHKGHRAVALMKIGTLK